MDADDLRMASLYDLIVVVTNQIPDVPDMALAERGVEDVEPEKEE